MLQKIIIRLFLTGLILFVTTLAALGFSGWLAFQQPPFYCKLMSQEFSELDRELATKKFETMAYSIEQLTARGELGRKNPGTIEAQMEQDRPLSKPIIPEKLEFSDRTR